MRHARDGGHFSGFRLYLSLYSLFSSCGACCLVAASVGVSDHAKEGGQGGSVQLFTISEKQRDSDKIRRDREREREGESESGSGRGRETTEREMWAEPEREAERAQGVTGGTVRVGETAHFNALV